MSIYVIIDFLFDLAMVVFGIVLLCKSRGNRMRLIWSALTLTIALIFIDDNIKLLLSRGGPLATHGFPYTDILVMGRMMEWIFPATACSLFPLLSLRPGFLTPARLLLFAMPVGAAMLTGVCYEAFNGHTTRLYGLADVWANIGETDVAVRLFIFAMGIVVPAVYFLFPALSEKTRLKRKATPMMWLFIAGMVVMLLYYAVFMVVPSEFMFGTINVVVECFFISFSVLFLLYEDPLSSRGQSVPHTVTHPSPAESLYAAMEAWMADHHPYSDPDYSADGLARDMKARRPLLVEAIKAGGFSGFREYVNYLRVEYFKRQAAIHHSNKSVKELMNDCGFTSRSSFYRLFSAYEQITPSEYIDRLRLKR